MEKPYVPFYKPYGMTDEEYEYEVRIAEQRLAEWEAEQEQIKNSSNTVLCDENCDPFFIKTDIYGYCKKCGKNLGYVRK